MDNKNYNILYAVIGISTLVVAIIGTTFAFFSATQTNDSDIKGSIAEKGGLELSVTPLTYLNDDGKTRTGNGIVPLNLIKDTDDGENWASQYVDAIKNKCIDSLGNNVCEIYKIHLANKSATSKIQVLGTLNLNSPGTKNLKWKLINGKVKTITPEAPEPPAEEVKSYEVFDSTAEPGDPIFQEPEYFKPNAQDTNGYLTVSTISGEKEIKPLEGNGAQDYYVIVWLEEIGKDQGLDDGSEPGSIAKSFTGTVTFDAVDTDGKKSGVTATFTKQVAQEPDTAA